MSNYVNVREAGKNQLTLTVPPDLYHVLDPLPTEALMYGIDKHFDILADYFREYFIQVRLKYPEVNWRLDTYAYSLVEASPV